MELPFRSLVFGGSGTLGRVVCRMLAEQGGQVAFTYHQGTASANQLPALAALRADLRSVAEVERVVAEAADALGGLDAVVHCAGLAQSPGDPAGTDALQQMDDISVAGWDELFAVNVRSAYFGCKVAVPHLRRSGGGNIVLLGSIGGVKPLPSPVHYAASKGALVAMAQAMAKELGNDNIRVNLVAPGVLDAGMSQTLPRALLDDYLKHCGVKRFGRAAEVAAVVAWLARHNTYITGQSVVVDGAL